MTPEQRTQFIEQMVSKLAERLEQQPDDIAGWMRLVRAYTVLGKRDEALAALERARQTFPDGSEKRTALDGMAVELGLGT
jgi:cytochrome c-type biogenesis protein CcmH